MTALTAHFKYSEAIASETADKLGIANTPTEKELATLHRTALKMEQVREILAEPIYVSSWFRCEELNKAVGGVPNSQHRLGEAVDFSCKGKTHSQVCEILKAHAKELAYDQLILEPNWVHISFLTTQETRDKSPRRQYLDLSK